MVLKSFFNLSLIIKSSLVVCSDKKRAVWMDAMLVEPKAPCTADNWVDSSAAMKAA